MEIKLNKEGTSSCAQKTKVQMSRIKWNMGQRKKIYNENRIEMFLVNTNLSEIEYFITI